VWIDLQPLGFSGAGGDNYASRWEDQAWHEAVRGNISLVMNHRAVLGYCEFGTASSQQPAALKIDACVLSASNGFANISLVRGGIDICDDCCPLDGNVGNITLQARFYNLIKSIDPYHLTTGAIQCNANTWMWSDIPAGVNGHFLPGGDGGYAPPTSDCNPDPGQQPMLQLSLDMLLVENYAATLRSHAHDGSWSDGGGTLAKTSIAPSGAIEGDVNTATDGAWCDDVIDHPVAPYSLDPGHSYVSDAL
jgi:hypothetical protein